jgi:hypothetical protein
VGGCTVLDTHSSYVWGRRRPERRLWTPRGSTTRPSAQDVIRTEP